MSASRAGCALVIVALTAWALLLAACGGPSATSGSETTGTTSAAKTTGTGAVTITVDGKTQTIPYFLGRTTDTATTRSTMPTASLKGTACPRWHVVAKGKNVPDLYDVSALSPTDVWAVGSRGGYEPSSMPLAAHWNGRRLQVMRPFTPSSPHGELSAVVAVARDDVWAVGIDGWGFGRPVVVHWNGRSWKVVPTPRQGWEGELSDIAAFSADDVWAIGELNASPERPLLMRWNGQRWRVVDMRNVAPKASGLSAIGGTSSGDVWAVGEQGLDAVDLSGVSPLILHWDGRAWNDVAVPYGGEAIRGIAVDAVSPHDVWTVYGSVVDNNSDVVAHWKGPGRPPVVYKVGMGDIAVVSPRSAWEYVHASRSARAVGQLTPPAREGQTGALPMRRWSAGRLQARCRAERMRRVRTSDGPTR